MYSLSRPLLLFRSDVEYYIRHPQCAYLCSSYDLLIHSLTRELMTIGGIGILTKKTQSWVCGRMMEEQEQTTCKH